MQKKRKKQARNPFPVMKKEEGEEKQELEFAEGFWRIKKFPKPEKKGGVTISI